MAAKAQALLFVSPRFAASLLCGARYACGELIALVNNERDEESKRSPPPTPDVEKNSPRWKHDSAGAPPVRSPSTQSPRSSGASCRSDANYTQLQNRLELEETTNASSSLSTSKSSSKDNVASSTWSAILLQNGKRVCAFATYGFLYAFLLGYNMDTVVYPLVLGHRPLVIAVVDVLVYSPFLWCPLFYVAKGMLDAFFPPVLGLAHRHEALVEHAIPMGENLKLWGTTVAEVVPTALRKYFFESFWKDNGVVCAFWIPANYMIYRFPPLEYRTLAGNVIASFWTCGWIVWKSAAVVPDPTVIEGSDHGQRVMERNYIAEGGASIASHPFQPAGTSTTTEEEPATLTRSSGDKLSVASKDTHAEALGLSSAESREFLFGFEASTSDGATTDSSCGTNTTQYGSLPVLRRACGSAAQDDSRGKM
ncbi:unnamed protein product [Amoebophrya sp. A25]|nr:unnamed protein product [Amoebophrya sp. A25]|eukprot:GSA25T00027374001.1